MAAGIDPIHQFEIKRYIPMEFMGYDISFTNSSFMMCLAILSVTLLFSFGLRQVSLIPSRLQLIVEVIYDFIEGMVKETNGEEGMRFFPFIFTLFLFIFTCNFLGLLPFAFTATSHLAVTATLAVVTFSFVIAVGLYRNGLHFFSLFLPSGLPLILKPIIIPIEIFSFFVRPFTLALRLCANMTAGHITLKIIAGLAAMMGTAGIIPFVALLLPLNALELFVAGLQAYLFALLTCVYLQSVTHIDH